MAEAGPSNGQAAAPAADAGNKHPSGIVPTLQNVVATVNLGCQLDLKQIAMQARNAEYNPKVSPIWLAPFWGHCCTLSLLQPLVLRTSGSFWVDTSRYLAGRLIAGGLAVLLKCDYFCIGCPKIIKVYQDWTEFVCSVRSV
jgi:hypothetical protein